MTALRTTAIDGRPASPAMAAALAAIDARCRERGAYKAKRQARIDADPRIIARRAAKRALEREYAEGMEGAFLIFADMAAGRLARRSIFASLIKARIALLDKDRAAARQFIRDANFARFQHWTVTKAEPGFVAMEQSVNHTALTATAVAGAVRLGEVA